MKLKRYRVNILLKIINQLHLNKANSNKLKKKKMFASVKVTVIVNLARKIKGKETRNKMRKIKKKTRKN